MRKGLFLAILLGLLNGFIFYLLNPILHWSDNIKVIKISMGLPDNIKQSMGISNKDNTFLVISQSNNGELLISPRINGGQELKNPCLMKVVNGSIDGGTISKQDSTPIVCYYHNNNNITDVIYIPDVNNSEMDIYYKNINGEGTFQRAQNED